MKQKTIIVTGGAGFIGSHLCERLLDKGHSVFCVDNFLTGKFENIEHLVSRKKFKIISHDVCEPLNIEADEIYNLACPASPEKYQKDPVKTVKTNVMGALTVLELAKKTGATVLQASTSEIYGEPLEHPQKESYWGNVNPIGVRSCYDEGKRCAETLFFDYHRQYKVKIKVARIFNTYGPKMCIDDGRVISNFITQALNNDYMTVYGNDGAQTRSFCYVDEMVEGLIRLMNSSDELIGPVNLGNPTEVSILDVAEKIKFMIHSSSKIIFKELPKDDPTRRQPDITLAKKELLWEPKIKLRDGLNKTIVWFKGVIPNE